MATPASRFIEESIKHSDWLKVIESGDPDAVVRLAKEQNFECSLEDLKGAASELLAGQKEGGQPGEVKEQTVNEAASGLTDLAGEQGYGDDTGYAALYGVAGAILKMGQGA